MCRHNRLGLLRPESLAAKTLSLTKEGTLGAGGTARGRPLCDLNNAKDFKDVAFTFKLLAASWTTISPTVFTAQTVCGHSTLHKTRQHFAKTRREAGSPRHRDSIPSRLATLARRLSLPSAQRASWGPARRSAQRWGTRQGAGQASQGTPNGARWWGRVSRQEAAAWHARSCELWWAPVVALDDDVALVGQLQP